MQKIMKRRRRRRPQTTSVKFHAKIVDDLGWIKRQTHSLVIGNPGDVVGAVVERFFHGLGGSSATALSIADGVTKPEKAGRIGKRRCLVEIRELLLAAVVLDEWIVHDASSLK